MLPPPAHRRPLRFGLPGLSCHTLLHVVRPPKLAMPALEVTALAVPTRVATAGRRLDGAEGRPRDHAGLRRRGVEGVVAAPVAPKARRWRARVRFTRICLILSPVTCICLNPGKICSIQIQAKSAVTQDRGRRRELQREAEELQVYRAAAACDAHTKSHEEKKAWRNKK